MQVGREDVTKAVGIRGHQVGGAADENNRAAIRTEHTFKGNIPCRCPCPPLALALTSTVVCDSRSRTKTSLSRAVAGVAHEDHESAIRADAP